MDPAFTIFGRSRCDRSGDLRVEMSSKPTNHEQATPGVGEMTSNAHCRSSEASASGLFGQSIAEESLMLMSKSSDPALCLDG